MLDSFPFVGVWKGQGLVSGFANYEEELVIEAFGTPKGKQLAFKSKTWRVGGNYDECPMHTEIGMLKVTFENQNKGLVELSLVHPFGLSEIECGEFHEDCIRVESINLIRTPTFNNNVVQKIRREYKIDNQRLSYKIFLTLYESQEFLHLEGNLLKQT